MRAALLVAIAADVSQWCVGPFGWVGVDQAIDVVAMIVAAWLLGFHPLLLQTVLIELFPVVDLLPTWTGCVLLVIARRKTQQAESDLPKPAIVNPPPAIGWTGEQPANARPQPEI